MAGDLKNKKIRPGLTRWIQVLFVINSGIWFVFGVNGLLSGEGAFGFPSGTGWIISGLMIVNGLVLLGFALLILLHRRMINLGAAAYVALNAILSITDEVGLFDYLVLGLNLVTLVLVLLVLNAEMPAEES